MRGVSIIIPVIRPEKAAETVKAIELNSGEIPYEILAEMDHGRIGCPRMVEKLAAEAKYELVMFLGDDTIPEAGFLRAAVEEMAKLPDGWGVIGLNTEDPRGSNPLAHWLADKRILAHIPGGEFFPIDYRHCWGDNELRDIAEELGRWGFAEGSRIRHNHPINKTAEWDAGYKAAYTDDNQRHDELTYYRRKIARHRAAAVDGVRLGVGRPLTDEKAYHNFFYSWEAIEKPDYELFISRHPGKLDQVRNDIILQALRAGVTHLLMIDTDQILFDEKMIEKMLAHELPIVSAIVCRRYPPFDPILFRHNGDGMSMPVDFNEIESAIEAGGIVGADVTGMGCVLFDMDVFTEIERPWFRLPEYGEAGPGEDIYFWNKARAAGFKILVDCSIKIEHITVMGIGFETHRLFRKLMEGMKNGGREQERT